MATPPAGWHSDPSRRHQHRYWDGTQWTDRVSDEGNVSVDRVGPRTPEGREATATRASRQAIVAQRRRGGRRWYQRPWAIALAVVLALFVVVGIVVSVIKSTSSTLPISQQTCAELNQTYRQIQRDLAPNQRFSVRRAATKRAGEVVSRLGHLGWCPKYPDLFFSNY